MADLSKQWCEINDPEMPYDFDILEEFGKLPKNHYITFICEGFGFLAIIRDEDDVCLLAEYDDSVEERVIWTPYDMLIK